MIAVATDRLHVDAKRARQKSELASSGNKVKDTVQRGGELDTKLLDFGVKGKMGMRDGEHGSQKTGVRMRGQEMPGTQVKKSSSPRAQSYEL